MSQTATDKFEINQLPQNPGDIQSLTVTEAPANGLDTSATWHYKKVGKLYFDIWVRGDNNGTALIIGRSGTQSDINDTLDHFAALLGLTINTYYSDPLVTQSPGNSLTYWNGANYVTAGSGVNSYIGMGFLSN